MPPKVEARVESEKSEKSVSKKGGGSSGVNPRQVFSPRLPAASPEMDLKESGFCGGGLKSQACKAP